MNPLPVVVHSDALIGASGPRLPREELEHICTLLSIGKASKEFLRLRQLASSYPEDEKRSFIGVYEAVWNYQGDNWFVYLTNSGFVPIEIRRISKGIHLLSIEDGQQWLDRAVALIRRLHEVLSTSESGV